MRLVFLQFYDSYLLVLCPKLRVVTGRRSRSAKTAHSTIPVFLHTMVCLLGSVNHNINIKSWCKRNITRLLSRKPKKKNRNTFHHTQQGNFYISVSGYSNTIICGIFTFFLCASVRCVRKYYMLCPNHLKSTCILLLKSWQNLIYIYSFIDLFNLWDLCGYTVSANVPCPVCHIRHTRRNFSQIR